MKLQEKKTELKRKRQTALFDKTVVFASFSSRNSSSDTELDTFLYSKTSISKCPKIN